MDIDPQLVGQANKLLALRASRTKHVEHTVDYFPISAILSHGYRIEPETASTDSLCRFFSADWVVAADQETSGPYDVILALSVSIYLSICWCKLNLSRLSNGYTWNTSTKVWTRFLASVRHRCHLVAISSSSCKPGIRTRKLFAQTRLRISLRT